MKLKLELPNASHKQEYLNMMKEWIAYGGRLNPAALINNGASYEKWLQWMIDDQNELTCPNGSVPQALYFLVDTSNHILGAITLRNYLNQDLLLDGGNIGYGIRPSERNKGYATKMLSLALKKCK
jgi:predicted acetyltransferase